MENSKKINYNELFEKEVGKINLLNKKPTLCLHICCAPCSSGCLEKLVEHFNVKVLFYNPNISLEEEYIKRKNELIKFINTNPLLSKVEIIDCKYEPKKFKEEIKGFEQEPEGGKRCEKCFRLRLSKTAEICKSFGCDYFTTTLTISPLKNASLLNEIGFEMAEKFGVNFLPSDFKKKDGYKTSIINSQKFGLYRQDYCGCIYSKMEREKQKEILANKNSQDKQ